MLHCLNNEIHYKFNTSKWTNFKNDLKTFIGPKSFQMPKFEWGLVVNKEACNKFWLIHIFIIIIIMK